MGQSVFNHFKVRKFEHFYIIFLIFFTFRNVKDIDKEAFSQRVEKWKKLGFINYFGAQRFGTCEINTAEVGRLILAQKWEEAVRLTLKPRNSETNCENFDFYRMSQKNRTFALREL
jgi:tRNA(Glu) U13 pseudouridine synthase TruD